MKNLLLTIPFLLVACGDDDSSSDQPSQTTTDLVTDNEPVTVIDATDEELWVYVDLDQGGTIVSESDNWDLAIQRYKIQLNTNTQPPTSAAIVEGAYGEIEIPAREVFATDTITEKPEDGYIFNGEDSWYNYDSSTHVLTPKENRIYVVYTSDHGVYQMQIQSYYNDVGTPAFLSFKMQSMAR